MYPVVIIKSNRRTESHYIIVVKRQGIGVLRVSCRDNILPASGFNAHGAGENGALCLLFACRRVMI